MSIRIGWRLNVVVASTLALLILVGSSPTLAQSSAAATGSAAVGAAPKPAALASPVRTAPGPVTRVVATAVTKTTVTISWVDPPSSTYTGVMIRRTTGSSPALTPTSGSLVADVRRPGTRVVSAGLTPGVTYSYALFAHDASGDYAAGAVTTASTEAANGPLSWGPERRIDRARGLLNAVSCASDSFCMAVDLNGNALIYNGTSWGPPAPAVDIDGARLLDVSCVSSTFCMAVDGSALVFNGTKWSAPTAPVTVNGDGLVQVSCTSPSWCMGLTYNGYASIYNGVGWSAVTQLVPPSAEGATFQSLSCQSSGSTHVCAVVDRANELLYYAGGRWATFTPPVFSAFNSVSCGSVTFCLAIGNASDVYTGVVRFNGSAWEPITRVPREIDGSQINGPVSCLASTICTAIDKFTGNTVRYNGSSWTGPTATGFDNPIDLSCATATFCVAVDYDSDELTLRGTAWSHSTIDPQHGGLASVSCASQSFCAAVGNSGDELTYNGRTWSSASLVGHSLQSVSCTSATFCMAVGFTIDAGGVHHGQVVRFDGQSWTAGTLDPALDLELDAVSCASSSYCIAVGSNYFVIYNGISWSTPQHVPNAGGGALGAVSCPSASFCMAVDHSGNSYNHGAGGWRPAVPSGLGTTAVSCVNPTFCMVVENFGTRAARFNGTSWEKPVAVAPHVSGFNTVSCASTTYCIAGNYLARAPGGTNGGYVARYDGTHWVADVKVDNSTIGVQSVSCPTISFCMAVTYRGDAVQAGFGPSCATTPSTTPRALPARPSPAQQQRIRSSLLAARSRPALSAVNNPSDPFQVGPKSTAASR